MWGILLCARSLAHPETKRTEGERSETGKKIAYSELSEPLHGLYFAASHFHPVWSRADSNFILGHWLSTEHRHKVPEMLLVHLLVTPNGMLRGYGEGEGEGSAKVFPWSSPGLPTISGSHLHKCSPRVAAKPLFLFLFQVPSSNSRPPAKLTSNHTYPFHRSSLSEFCCPRFFFNDQRAK
jgi:hypothetical protein